MGARRARVALVQAPVFDIWTPSNALAMLSALLRGAGLDARIHDASIAVHKTLSRRAGTPLTREDFMVAVEDRDAVDPLLLEQAERVLEGEPDVAAFSILYRTEAATLRMAEHIKRLAPRCKVVLGGAQCLRENMAYELAAHPAVDAVVVGEADRSAVDFFSRFDPGAETAPRAAGVLTKEDGAIFDGGEAEVVEDLDSLPFMDFSGFDMDDYAGNKLFMYASRGCVRKCAFCTHILQHKTFRVMSPERVVAEIRQQLADYPGRNLVVFSDSLINGHVRNLKALAERLIELRADRLVSHRGLDFGWEAMAIIHPTLTAALLKRLQLSGCRQLAYGLESASQKVVDLMQKNFRVADAERVIRDTAAAGIVAELFIMVGFPGETEADFQLTLDFIERNAEHLGGVAVSYCEVQKGSELERRAGELGMRVPLEDGRHWVSRDGSNTLATRMDRARRVYELVARLGLSINMPPTEERLAARR